MTKNRPKLKFPRVKDKLTQILIAATAEVKFLCIILPDTLSLSESGWEKSWKSEKKIYR